MTPKRSDPSQINGTSAETGTADTSQADATADAQQNKTGTDSRARERAAEAGEALRDGARHVTGITTNIATRTQQAVPAPVRHVVGGAATRTRRLTAKVAAWARRNPKAVAAATAGTVTVGPALWRRITRRGQRR